MPTEPDAEDRATCEAAVFDFVADYLEDRDSGLRRPLTAYLARYPGHEDAVALEYLRLSGAALPSWDTCAEATPSEAALPDDGARRLGHYRLVRELGRGGQGAVWLAEDEHLGRKVALKLLTTPFVTVERRGRFRREAESIARLDHPGLAGVHDADLDADVPWISMRYVEGIDLGAALERAREASAEREPGAPERPLLAPLVPLVPKSRAELARVLLFFERAARALHAAHEEGVVHRDIKPGNIMVAAPGVPVVLDFGLARGVDQHHAREEVLTREGELFGTPAYMAPEQFAGHADELDRRADVWSLGVTLFEALTGERPFQGNNPHLLARAILEQPVRDPRELNAVLTLDVKVVLETSLERDRARRYASALEFAEDLRRIREFEPVRARPAGPFLRAQRWCRREPAWAATIGVTLVALVLGLVASLAALKRMGRLLFDRNEALTETRIALDLARARLYVGVTPEFLTRSPAGALALGLEAVRRHDAWWSRSALYGPLEELTLEHHLSMPEGRIWQAALFDDGARLVAGATGRHVAVFDLRSGTELAARTLGAEHEREEARRLAVVADGHGVLVGAEDGTLYRLTLPELEEVWARTLGGGPVQWIAPMPRRAAGALPPIGLEEPSHELPGAFPEEALVVTSEGEVLVVDCATGTTRARVALPRGASGEARVVAIGAELYAVIGPRSRSGKPFIEDTVARVVALGGPGDARVVAELSAEALIRRMDVVSVTGDSTLVALGTSGGAVRMFELSASAGDATARGDGAGGDGSRLEVRALTSPPMGPRVAVEDLAWADAECIVGFGRGAGEVLCALDPRHAPARALFKTALDVGVFGVLTHGDVAVAACTDSALRVLERATGRLLHAHHEEVHADSLLWDPHERRLVSFGVTRHIAVWRERPTSAAMRAPLPAADAAHGGAGGARAASVVRLGGAFEFAAATDDGRVLALARTADPRAPRSDAWRTLVQPPPPALASETAPGTPPATRASALAATPDGARFATGGPHGALRLWTGDGELIAEHAGDPLGATQAAIVALSLADDGSVLLALSADGRVLVLAPHAEVAQLDWFGPASAVCVAPRGDLAAIGYRDGSSAVFELPARRLRFQLASVEDRRSSEPAVRDLAFSRDATRLVVASHQSRLDVVSLERGEREGPSAGSMPEVRWARPLADGRVFTQADGILTGRVITLPTGGVGSVTTGVHEEKLHDLAVTCLDVAPDGRLIATGSLDGAVHVIDPTTGALIARYDRHTGPVRALDIGADGRVASVADDGTVAVWPIDPVPLAKALAPRELTQEERRRLENLVGGR